MQRFLKHIHTATRAGASLALFSFPMLALGQYEQTRVETPPPGRVYWTSGGEWNLTAPMLDVNGSDRGGVVRFAPFFNLLFLANYDASDHFGLFSGFTIRNLGFIYQAPESDERFKYRTYNLGIPIGFKLGRMHRSLVFAGYELELPFNYKEKRFLNERKEDKFNVWFSDRNTSLMQSVMLGVQGPGGATLALKYYITNFHNEGFRENIDGVDVFPYAGLNANLLLLSFTFDLFNGERTLLQDLPGDRTRDVETRR